MKKWLIALSLLTMVPIAVPAARARTADELLEKLSQPDAELSFTGSYEFNVIRAEPGSEGGRDAIADKLQIELDYINRRNYSLKLSHPSLGKGILEQMVKGVGTVDFGDDDLRFSPIAGVLLDLLATRIEASEVAAVRANYRLELKSAGQKFLGEDTDVVEFTPVRAEVTPRRICWISRKSMHILHETRYWDRRGSYGNPLKTQDPYFEASYRHFVPITRPRPSASASLKPAVTVTPEGAETKYTHFARAETASGRKLHPSSYLPPGFSLKSLEVFKVFETWIELQHYTDGLHHLLVLIKSEAPGTQLNQHLQAGFFQSLYKLAAQLPYNYALLPAQRETAVVFGDLMPEQLQRVSRSLSLPASSPNLFDNW